MKKAIMAIIIGVLLAGIFLGSCGEPTTEPTTTTTTKPAITTTTEPTTTTTTKPTTTTTTKPTTTPTSEIVKGGTLQFIYPYSPSSTPGWPNERAEFQKLWLEWVTYEPLIKMLADGTPTPYLATSWEWGPDNAYVTFTLRQGVKFHDGTDFTSEAVKLEGDIVISTEESNAITWDRWEIIDDYTVRLYLKEFRNDFWGTVAGINMCFFSPTAYNAHQPDGQAYIKENPIGTGPFKFVSFEKDVSMKFVKNEDYWQEGKPYLDGIDFITVKEELTTRAKMEAGEGDISALMGGKILQDMENAGFIINARYGGTDFLMFDTMNPDSKYTDVRVRMAVEYAIEKEALAETLGYGYYQANNQMPPADNPTHNFNIPSRDYDPDKARQLLTEAGFPDGFSDTLLTFVNEPKELSIQEYLKEVGINVTLDVVDNAKYWNYMMTGWTGMVSSGYAVGINFAAWVESYFPPTGIFDVSCKIPDHILEKIEPALREPDPVKKKALDDEIIRLMYEDATIIPIYSNALGYILNPRVHDSNCNTPYWLDWSVWDPADTWLSE
jgi:peptide/nickel transport system substrate-binding protein